MTTWLATSDHDDRFLPATRVAAALIVPFLAVAFVMLYLLPDDTDRLFAWTIRPRMSALLMGAGYASGVYFLIRVVRAWGDFTSSSPLTWVFVIGTSGWLAALAAVHIGLDAHQKPAGGVARAE